MKSKDFFIIFTENKNNGMEIENSKELLELTNAVLELSELFKVFLEHNTNHSRNTMLKVGDVAKMLGCTTANIEQSKFIIHKNPDDKKKQHLYISGNKRQIPCYNIGKANYKYKREDVLAYMEGRKYRYDKVEKKNVII